MSNRMLIPSTNGYSNPHLGLLDPVAINRLSNLVSNISSIPFQGRRSTNMEADKRRNIAKDCGWPEDSELTPEFFRDMFDRVPEANRVVEILPKECFKVTPRIFENADPECPPSEFEKSLAELEKWLAQGQEGWFEDEEAVTFVEYLERADVLSGIGPFGVMLLGLDDGKPLHEKVEPKQGMKLNFIRVFDASTAKVGALENDIKNPRYGMPTHYNITFNDPRTFSSGSSGSVAGLDITERRVHWSRVVHVAIDGLVSSEIYCSPRMYSCIDPLLDIRKLRGGSAEGYWQEALPVTHIGTHPALGGDVVIDKASLQSQVYDTINGLQRWLYTSGMDVNKISGQVSDPTPQISVQLDSICIRIGVPKRIFIGSERGELASSQDEKAHNERVNRRRKRQITPRLIVPLINRLIKLGALKQPKTWGIEWPEEESLTPMEQAQVAQAEISAIGEYVSSGAEAMLTPLDFYTNFLRKPERIAKQIISSAKEAVEDEETITPAMQQQAQSQEQHDAMAEQGFPQPGAFGEEGAEGDEGSSSQGESGEEEPFEKKFNQVFNQVLLESPVVNEAANEVTFNFLFTNAFPGQKGRKGKRGGSMPKLEFFAPPNPLGKAGGRAGGLSSMGRTNTDVGDTAERILAELGLVSLLKGKRQGPLDVGHEDSGYAFEVKAVTTRAAEYKAKPKKAEVLAKIKYARKNKLKPGTMIVVMDYDTGKAHAYWRKGIGAYRLQPGNYKDWNYAGSVAIKEAVKKGADE